MSPVEAFTKDPRVLAALALVRTQCAGKAFSDLRDRAGRQYIDLVMEGGGVLGIALTGYTYVLEQSGIRFLGIGGTSAGCINALLLAALGNPAEAKTERMIEVLAAMPMAWFIDGDADARDFCQAALDKAPLPKLLWKAAQVVDNLKEDLGLNPGKAFFDWLTGELRKAGVRDNRDLQRKLAATPPELGEPGRLALIAADITTESKVEFPKMAGLYWSDPDAVNPASFARASMSIPFFFHPYRVADLPAGTAAKWQEYCGYAGRLPQSVMLMDGGIMSNFPINLFHEPYRVPPAPTFGAKIGIDRSEPATIGKPAQLLGAIFDAARHTLDYDFITQNPDYRKLVTMIDTGEHHWLDFAMAGEAKVDLFARGAAAAAQFLCEFDWAGYKEIRKGIAEAFRASRIGARKDPP